MIDYSNSFTNLSATIEEWFKICLLVPYPEIFVNDTIKAE